jgi:hypothetical protein
MFDFWLCPCCQAMVILSILIMKLKHEHLILLLLLVRTEMNLESPMQYLHLVPFKTSTLLQKFETHLCKWLPSFRRS